MRDQQASHELLPKRTQEMPSLIKRLGIACTRSSLRKNSFVWSPGTVCMLRLQPALVFLVRENLELEAPEFGACGQGAQRRAEHSDIGDKSLSSSHVPAPTPAKPLAHRMKPLCRLIALTGIPNRRVFNSSAQRDTLGTLV
ncbi:hypothetical protein RRG08_028855 [Elysia crispata]|uniref:Uncharacterized protein n=1 Tax=Elysia crispata TaxID=231223 RepID=A0AAE1D833_9GAST|nr:hypothetical protein RRG08_028855 [Elysia crispata]